MTGVPPRNVTCFAMLTVGGCCCFRCCRRLCRLWDVGRARHSVPDLWISSPFVLSRSCFQHPTAGTVGVCFYSLFLHHLYGIPYGPYVGNVLHRSPASACCMKWSSLPGMLQSGALCVVACMTNWVAQCIHVCHVPGCAAGTAWCLAWPSPTGPISLHFISSPLGVALATHVRTWHVPSYRL